MFPGRNNRVELKLNCWLDPKIPRLFYSVKELTGTPDLSWIIKCISVIYHKFMCLWCAEALQFYFYFRIPVRSLDLPLHKSSAAYQRLNDSHQRAARVEVQIAQGWKWLLLNILGMPNLPSLYTFLSFNYWLKRHLNRCTTIVPKWSVMAHWSALMRVQVYRGIWSYIIAQNVMKELFIYCTVFCRHLFANSLQAVKEKKNPLS